MLETFTLATFAGRLDQTFRVRLDPLPPLALELVQTSDLSGGATPSDRRAPFSIVFRGPREPCLPQQTYPLEHDELGTFDLFIVPIGPDDRGMQYEAVFG